MFGANSHLWQVFVEPTAGFPQNDLELMTLTGEKLRVLLGIRAVP
jgi:hypothetical protein